MSQAETPDNIRTPLLRPDRKAAADAIARRHLGELAKNPLIDRILYWIEADELWMALEEAEVVKAGAPAKLLSVEDVSHEVLEALRRAIQPTQGE